EGKRLARGRSLDMARHSTRLLPPFVVVTVVLWSALPTFALAPSVVFTARRDFVAGTNPLAVAAGDFNRDGVQDLAAVNAGDNTVSVLLGDGRGAFQPARAFGAGASPRAVVVGDFNRDGVPDLAVADYGANAVSVLLGNPDGTFRPARTYGTGNGPWALAVD